ncbi:MAG TPA: type II toxin-antitoxin system VapC family toxin [Pseudolysinimonas sp.]|nr:type II toxin-antitoxin system VapC family toxin [Pseudolysinimonas sp.]
MRLLVDTHALIWWFDDHASLGAEARSAMADPQNDVFVSSLSFAEIAIKQRLGKLNGPFISDELLAEQGMTPLPLSPRHGRKVVELPMHHRDPFDRLLIAQALEEGLTILTSDSRFAAYGVPVLAA